MMSSLRRFVYLVTGDQRRRTYLLRRIDTSRCFLPRPARRDCDRLLTDTPPPLEEARLPASTMKFDPHNGYVGLYSMDFMLFAGGDDRRNRVFAADGLGRALLYDPKSPSVRAMPGLTALEFQAASITVGDDVYVLATSRTRSNEKRHCFKAFVYDDDEWSRHPLPPPPFVVNQPRGPDELGCSVGSYAVAGGSSIWVSEFGTHGTYSFDTASRAWTWAKAGESSLPFRGQGHHVPELGGVWVGLSSLDGHVDGIVCRRTSPAAGSCGRTRRRRGGGRRIIAGR
ncbi:hypothetical protein HU200_056421 [Digitaria exilis]|uniref:Uncharacterized protein n=1 Tax=Digitaria exilis TaxID=1010633 RepID=A0A835AJ32_9POAL|nr:hypothetical protein HU200_056421 [Digitaria exilis]